MLRAVLVGLLSVSAAVACKSSSDAPASQPGVAVGKVIEVSGTVTVRHGDVARPLAKGESVEGDDIVETGADGNVIVELAHNLARWELGPNKKSKVRESAAWSLPKKTGDAAKVEQDTAAAGRPAERSAADTSVSATIESTAAPAAPAAAPAPTAAAPTPDPAAEPPREAPAKPKRAREVTRQDALERASGGGAAPKQLSRKLEANAADDALGTADAEGGGGVRTRGAVKAAPAPAPAPPPAPVSASPPAPPPPPGSTEPNAAARDLVVRHQAAIKECLTNDVQAVSLRVVVNADGKATVIVKSTTEVPAAVQQCVTSAVQKISFAKTSANVTLDVAR
jgi:hypothetical protein